MSVVKIEDQSSYEKIHIGLWGQKILLTEWRFGGHLICSKEHLVLYYDARTRQNGRRTHIVVLRIHADSAPIRANSASIHTDLGRFLPIRPKSGRIGSYRPAAETNQNRPKSALNHAGTAIIGFEWDPNILNLSFLNFILNICYFFCIFFFVLCFILCFLPSSFFVLWTKDI